MKPLNFYHLTDLHYYANEVIGSYGEKYELKDMLDQKCMDKSGAIIDAAFRDVCEDKETDIVLISGDLTFDGEVQSHDALIEKLYALKEKGKRVFITFATHDFYMHARKYTDEGETELPKYTRAQLREKYADFGYNEAIAEHKNSYSYCVQLSDDVRLLALNDDGDFDKFCGFYNDLLFWIKDQIEAAHEAGCEIFAMTHHPILEPSPVYPLFSHKAMLGGYEFTGPYLANAGLEYIFVGHTHIHDINSLTTDKGNTLYQVNTAALTAYPLAYRKIEFSDKGMDVKTVQVTEIDADTDGMSVLDYSKKHFTYMIELIFDSLENDFDKFCLLAQGFSVDGEKLRKVESLLHKFGKMVNGLTFKKLCGFFGCGKYVDSSIADDKIVKFLCSAIVNMYSGNEVYSPDTPEYKAIIPVCQKLGKVIKIKDHSGNRVDIAKLVAGIICDDGINDIEAFLPAKCK
ncbi:MAG: metallophosphoesterase [Clostridia bacterium]|nr:metallophosphoesterase [Clostridia bacterium]